MFQSVTLKEWCHKVVPFVYVLYTGTVCVHTQWCCVLYCLCTLSAVLCTVLCLFAACDDGDGGSVATGGSRLASLPDTEGR